ncbi:MAG: AAA family ATPase [Verrucomicrobiota bacterium]
MQALIAHHGLKRMPFDKAIKTGAALETEPAKECAARLDFIKQRGGILLLTGDPGVGKTIALRKFCDGLNENIYRPLYTPLSTLKGADLLRHLNDKLGLQRRASKAAVYEQLQAEMLESREQRGKTVVIIIDEAHLLGTASLQELRLLTNFKMDSFDPFILILAGQIDLRKTMELGVMEAFSQRVALRHTMAPLDGQETVTYVEEMMKLAGAREPIFAPDALAAIHEVSFGIPRRIGMTAEMALTLAMLDNRKNVDADLVLKAKSLG